MRKITTPLAAAMLIVAAGAASVAQDASPEPPARTIGEPADDGARIVAVEDLDGRTVDLTFESPAVGDAKARLLLPAAFDRTSDERFPVLYLLHGAGGGYVDWTKETAVAAMTAPTDLLVVMPDAATSDPGPDGESGAPNWEQFHLLELHQLMERNWRAQDLRAIAGLSLGGYSAVMTASNHPQAFEAVAAYSGALDLTVASSDDPEVQAIVDEAHAIAEEAGWDEANPVNLVSRLDGMPLYISYGNGEPGPLDPPGTDFDPLEAWIGTGGDNYAAALEGEGIEATVNDYGPGTHDWTYWERELGESLPLILEALGEDAPAASASPTP